MVIPCPVFFLFAHHNNYTYFIEENPSKNTNHAGLENKHCFTERPQGESTPLKQYLNHKKTWKYKKKGQYLMRALK